MFFGHNIVKFGLFFGMKCCFIADALPDDLFIVEFFTLIFVFQLSLVFGVTPIGDGLKKTEEFPLKESGENAWEADMDHTVPWNIDRLCSFSILISFQVNFDSLTVGQVPFGSRVMCTMYDIFDSDFFVSINLNRS